MPRLTGALAKTLEKNRSRCNARYFLVQQKVDSEEFSDLLCTVIAPIVDSLPEEVQESTALALYDSGLKLMSKKLLGPGSRFPGIDRLWQQHLAYFLRFAGDQSIKLISSLSNAIFNLSQKIPLRCDQWLNRLAVLAPHCSSPEQLLQAGQVLAWTHGMAHWRSSAIALWRQLPPPLQEELLGCDPQHARFDQRWRQPHQSNMDGRPRIVARAGGFVGLGGMFRQPPEVLQIDGVLYAFDGQRCVSIHADCFGSWATVRHQIGSCS